ncbi:MAG: HEAT repeat domain-containing protein [Syntrophaceae bacterium]|nr:HEAT repeat domain-containing protein [Deltaproteobacteria bacterium]
MLNQILKDLFDSDPEIKKMAAKAILKDADEPAQVFSSILKEADRPTATVVYDVLFDAEGDFSSIFRAATGDDDAQVRNRAIRYLFRRGMLLPQDGISWLEDSDPFVRRRVISYLFWMNDRTSLGAVVRLSNTDPDPMVRKDCLRLISIWGTKSEVPHLIKALEDPSHMVRTQAVHALKRLTGEDFGEPLGASPEEFEWIVAKWQGWWEIMGERT